MATACVGEVRLSVGLDNTSDRWLVVGDYHEVISHHAARAEAAAALDAIGMPGADGLADARWARVDLVGPGESVSGRLVKALWADDGRDAGADLAAAIFGDAEAR